MASLNNNFNFPYFSPPPPSHPSLSPPPPPHVLPSPPPPPHILPPPTPLPPSPSPNNHSTVIIVVFVSLGGILFLAFLAFGLCCLIKKKKKKSVQETEIVHVDEHLKVKEAIVQGPHGSQAVVLEIDDDLHMDEIIRKNEEEQFGKNHHNAIESATSSSSNDLANHHRLLRPKV